MIERKTPRPYQQDAVEAVIKGFENEDRGMLVLPCGTGKTLISLWVHEKMNANLTLVFLPSLSLLKQTKEEWITQRKEPLPYICICSDKDIDFTADELEFEKTEIDSNVTTDFKVLGEFIKNNPRCVVYTTYHSSKVIKNVCKDFNVQFDLVICDEAHRTSGYRKKNFSLINNDRNINVKKRLYVTATPRKINPKRLELLSGEQKKSVFDMDDKSFYGSIFYQMTFKEAIEKDILCDYKIVAMGISNKEMAEYIHNQQYIIDNENSVHELAHNYALEKFMKKYGATHAVTFHSSIEKASNFRTRHENLFPEIASFHINGHLKADTREIILKTFKEKPFSVISNVRCLSEGIDIPKIDCIYFCDAKESTIDIIQSAGRAMRKSPGKTMGYIVIPIFHTSDNNLDDEIFKSDFQNYITIFKMLMMQDERLIDDIKNFILNENTEKRQYNFLEKKFIEISNLDIQKEHFFDQIIDYFEPSYLPYEEATKYVHTLNLKTLKEWEKYWDENPSKVERIPKYPSRTYKKKGWISAYHWLRKTKPEYWEFEKAREYIHLLNIPKVEKWNEYSRTNRADFIPPNPYQYYKNKGWVSWPDWLGYERVRRTKDRFLPYEEAHKFVKSLNLKSCMEWKKYVKNIKLPTNVPSSPDRIYKNKGWVSWKNWIGTRKIFSYEEAKKYVHALNLNSKDEWDMLKKNKKIPSFLPQYPFQYYKNKGWEGWAKFLNLAPKYLPYEEAKKYVHALNLKSVKEWQAKIKDKSLPNNICRTPHAYYKDEWENWGEWLGSKRMRRNPTKLSYEEAKKIVSILKLKNQQEWVEFVMSKKNIWDLPKQPAMKYRNEGWEGWAKFLNIPPKYLPYEEAKKYVHTLKIKNRKEWRLYVSSKQKPFFIPGAPELIYKNNGWKDYKDWLGD